MGTNYPSSLDDTTKFPTNKQDDANSISGADEGTSTNVGYHAQQHNDAGAAIVAVETELGLDPSGAASTVRERFETLDLKQSCKAATTAALPAGTYSAGVFTETANGALPAQDGVTLVNGDRLFVKDQAAPLQNGIYTVTVIGTAGTQFVLTRAVDADTAVKLNDTMMVTVEQGTLNQDSVWELRTDNPITVGTTALRYTRISPAYNRVTGPANMEFGPTGAKIENIPRTGTVLVNTASLTTAILRLFPLGVVRAGDTMSSLTCYSGTTGAGTPVNQWACLVRVSDRQIMAVSADATNGAWAANTAKTFTFGAAYTPDKDELFWWGLMVKATTVPTGAGLGAATGIQALSDTPVTFGNSNTAQTTPLSVTTIVTAPSAAAGAGNIFYCYVS